MKCKLQKEGSNNTKKIKDEREWLLLSYNVVGGEHCQEESSEGLNKKPMKHWLYLSVIRVWFILKRVNNMIQEKVEQWNFDSSVIVTTL